MCLRNEEAKSYTVHLRTQGRSYELAGDEVGLPASAADDELLARVAALVDMSPRKLEGHAVDRHDDVVVIRPWAVWG